MVRRIIEFSLRHRLLVALAYAALAGWGWWALIRTPIDAIPDLSDNQVIVFTDWTGHSPQEVRSPSRSPSTCRGFPACGWCGPSPRSASPWSLAICTSAILLASPSGRLTTTAFPDDRIVGRVAYIDPQVTAETRTARIRVEVQNPGPRLRLGMYADVHLETPEVTKSLLVPRSAVQNVGERTVVYLADPRQAGRFIEREIRLGDVVGDHVAVLSGVAPADRIVSTGSFSLRAERERLGLRPTN
jgi:hypothetical protein